MGEDDGKNCGGCRKCGGRRLEEIVEYSQRVGRTWCRETATPSCQAQWTPDNPALGQCAVSALLIQDRFGGELLRTAVAGLSHYRNRLPGGLILDITAGQFSDGAVFSPDEVRSREYVLDSPGAVAAKTRERYELLKAKVESADE